MWYIFIALFVFIQLTIEDHVLHTHCPTWEKNGIKHNASLAILWGAVLIGLLWSLWISEES